jgi:hypothetical protein
MWTEVHWSGKIKEDDFDLQFCGSHPFQSTDGSGVAEKSKDMPGQFDIS